MDATQRMACFSTSDGVLWSAMTDATAATKPSAINLHKASGA
jgi:hypothetical protein